MDLNQSARRVATTERAQPVQIEMFADILDGLDSVVAANAAANLRSFKSRIKSSGAEFWSGVREAEKALEMIGHERMRQWLRKHLDGQFSVPELRRLIKMRQAIENRADGKMLLRTAMEIACGSFTVEQITEMTQAIAEGISPAELAEMTRRGHDTAVASRERGPNESTVKSAVYEFLRCDSGREVLTEFLLDTGVRADIVTHRKGDHLAEYVVEVKRVLAERDWHEALGQLAEYSADPALAGHNLVVAFRDYAPEIEPRMLTHAERTGLRLLHVDPARNIARWMR